MFHRWFLAYTALVLAVLIWGANFAVVKVAAEAWSEYNFTLLAVRFWIAFLVYAALKHVLPVGVRTRSASSAFPFWPTIAVGVALAVGYGAQTRYLTDGKAINAAFLTSTTVLWAPLLGLLEGVKLRVATALGVIAAFGGILLMEGTNVQSSWAVSSLAVIAAIAFAVEINLTSRYISDKGVTEWTARTTFVVALIMTGGAAILDAPRWPPPISTEIVLAILFMAIVATAIALLLQNWAQAQQYQDNKVLDGPRVALISTLEPVFAAIVTVIFLHETMSVFGVLGCVLILIGTLLSEVAAARTAAEASSVKYDLTAEDKDEQIVR